MSVFDKFDGVIHARDPIPEAISARVDSSLLERFHQGKEVFFKAINHYHPEIYDYLMNDMSDLVIARNDIGSAPYYYFSLVSENKSIYSSIPRTFRELKTKRSDRDYYESLPEALKVFYYGFDSFDISIKDSLSLHECGFLLSFSNWYDSGQMNQYCKDTPGYKEFASEYSSLDVSVIARNQKNDIIIHDKSNRLQHPILTNWEDFREAEEIEDVSEVLQSMFFNSMNSNQT